MQQCSHKNSETFPFTLPKMQQCSHKNSERLWVKGNFTAYKMSLLKPWTHGNPFSSRLPTPTSVAWWTRSSPSWTRPTARTRSCGRGASAWRPRRRGGSRRRCRCRSWSRWRCPRSTSSRGRDDDLKIARFVRKMCPRFYMYVESWFRPLSDHFLRLFYIFVNLTWLFLTSLWFQSFLNICGWVMILVSRCQCIKKQKHLTLWKNMQMMLFFFLYSDSRFAFCVPKFAWKRDTKWVVKIGVQIWFQLSFKSKNLSIWQLWRIFSVVS